MVWEGRRDWRGEQDFRLFGEDVFVDRDIHFTAVQNINAIELFDCYVSCLQPNHNLGLSSHNTPKPDPKPGTRKPAATTTTRSGRGERVAWEEGQPPKKNKTKGRRWQSV